MFGNFTDLELSLGGRQTVETCTRLIAEGIQNGTFDRQRKTGYAGQDDVVTSLDLTAQQHYARLAASAGVRLVAEEEDDTSLQDATGLNIYTVADGLDGTLIASQGGTQVGSMWAAVRNGIVVTAYAGNAATGAIMGYSPDGQVWRWLPDGKVAPFAVDTTVPLSSLPLMIRRPPEEHHPLVRALANSTGERAVFSGHATPLYSWILNYEQLWLQQGGALVVRAGRYATPWDDIPAIGISLRLGFVYLEIQEHNGCVTLVQVDPTLPLKVTQLQTTTIVVHKDYVGQLMTFVQEHNQA